MLSPYETYGGPSTSSSLRAPDRARIMPTSNGSVIAVSYEARAFGIKRNMNALAARRLCPELQTVQVPTLNGKADLTLYRDRGNKARQQSLSIVTFHSVFSPYALQVAEVLSRLAVTERASIDEVYLDVTAEALRRLAGIPPGSKPPEPESFVGIHVAGEIVEAEGQGREQSKKRMRLPRNEDAITSGSDEGDFEASKEEPGEDAGPRRGARKDDGLLTSEAAARRWWRRPPAEWDEPDKNARLLATGAVVVSELRRDVEQILGFTCSAGIAHHKILCKLGSGGSKLCSSRQLRIVLILAAERRCRNAQAEAADGRACVLCCRTPCAAAPRTAPWSRRQAGRAGALCLRRSFVNTGMCSLCLALRQSAQVASSLAISTVGELAVVPLPRLEAKFPQSGLGLRLARLARGIDGEEVEGRMLAKSMSCGKTFRKVSLRFSCHVHLRRICQNLLSHRSSFCSGVRTHCPL